MTYHSIERAVQRACMNEDAAVEFIGKAENRGLGADDLPTKERKYMEKLKKPGSYPVYYGGYLFILGEGGAQLHHHVRRSGVVFQNGTAREKPGDLHRKDIRTKSQKVQQALSGSGFR